MIGVVADAVALVDRPHTPSLTIAAVATIAGWLYHLWSQHATRPAPAIAPDDAPDQKPAPIAGRPLESPAVVAMLTNGFRVPATAITATALDLASRGWVRLAGSGSTAEPSMQPSMLSHWKV